MLILAGPAVDFDGFGERAVNHGGGEGGIDDMPVAPGRQFHAGPGEAGDMGPQRLLRRLRAHIHILEAPEAPVMRERAGLGPGAPDDVQPLGERLGRVLERRAEGAVFQPVVAAPGGEIHPAAGEQVERRPVLRHLQRVVDRQQHDRRRQPDARGGAGKLRQQHVRRGVDAQQVEMMLADPGGIEADGFGVKRLFVDFADQRFGRARIAGIAVVREGEVAELHGEATARRCGPG